MLEPYASFFVRWFTDYQEIDRELARWEARRTGRVPKQQLTAIFARYALDDAAGWFRSLGMRYTERHLRRLHQLRNARPTPSAADLRAALREMVAAIGDDAEDCVFLFVPLETASIYYHPLRDWPKVVEAFPGTAEDIASAAECLAVQQPTASVFHSMRVLEKGLRGLASRLRIPMSVVADATWERIISSVEVEIDRRFRRAPTGGGKLSTAQKRRRRASLTHYYEFAIHFRYFKDVWRNYVMHDKASYNHDQARGVFGSVRDFMVDMAAKMPPRA